MRLGDAVAYTVAVTNKLGRDVAARWSVLLANFYLLTLRISLARLANFSASLSYLFVYTNQLYLQELLRHLDGQHQGLFSDDRGTFIKRFGFGA